MTNGIKTAYWLGIIGGLWNIVISAYLLYEPLKLIYEAYVLNKLSFSQPSVIKVIFGFYFLIIYVWIFSNLKKTKSDTNNKLKYAIANLILGILTINILVVISSLIMIVIQNKQTNQIRKKLI